MNTSDWIAFSGVAFGLFATVIASVWHLSFKIGALSQRVDTIEKVLATVVEEVRQMRIEITGMRIELSELQVKMNVLWTPHITKSKSPITLNEHGQEILAKSHIDSFATEHYDEILRKVRSFDPENAYQSQELLISIVGRYKREDQYKLRLQELAFSSGYDIDSLLFVAALSIRDRVVKDLGFESAL